MTKKNGITNSKASPNKAGKDEFAAKKLNRARSISTRTALGILVIIFLFSVISLFCVYSLFPELEESEKQFIKLPRDIEDAKSLGVVLSRYKEKYYIEVLGGVFITYIL